MTLTESIAEGGQSPTIIMGKVGEFLQGVDQDGSPILYSATTISSEFSTRAFVLPASSFYVSTENRPDRKTRKTERAIQSLLTRRYIDRPWNFGIRLESSSPCAKGLGASSADMAAGLLAAAAYLSLEVTDTELFSIMCAVERSDFLFCPAALVRANPLSAEFSIKGPAPCLWLVGWDSEPERGIETEAVAHLDYRRRRYGSEYMELVSYCDSGELDAFLYAVTRSSEINQELLPKPCFDWAHEIAGQFEAALLVAHSGTFMAFAIPCDRSGDDRQAVLQRMLAGKGFRPIVFQTGSSSGDGWRGDDSASSAIDNGALSDSLGPVLW
ncbi:MAG: hypothetical protein JO279_09855 [Verrucomicrobia bacterium]|nr:hypothetical protein [Verrucomicrobiota bacterium]